MAKTVKEMVYGIKYRNLTKEYANDWEDFKRACVKVFEFISGACKRQSKKLVGKISDKFFNVGLNSSRNNYKAPESEIV